MKNPKDSLRDKSRLAFELLENEFEVMAFDETFEIKGGTAETSPNPQPWDPSLTAEEKWAWDNPWAAAQGWRNKNIAESYVSGMPGAHNGVGDAFRHTVWMALIRKALVGRRH